MGTEKRHLELADRLRRLRVAAGYATGKVFAQRLGWQASKVSRIENGRTLPADSDVTEWLRAAGVGAPDADLVRDELRDLRLERDRWRQQLRHGHAERQRQEAAAEREVSRIVSVEMLIVPGLVQTADYARRVFRLAADLHETPSDIDAALAERLRRQAALYDSTGTVEVLIGESALRYPCCSQPVLLGQLDRLRALLDLEHIRLGVVPLDVVQPTITLHGYVIHDDRVTVEVNHTEITVTEPDDVALYERITTDLWRIAVEGDDARNLLAELAAARTQQL